MQQQRLTPCKNADIINSLFAGKTSEKRMARQVVGVQVAVTLIATGIAYGLSGALHFAAAVLCGGAVSVLNGAMLAWRMSRATLYPVNEARQPGGVHRQLRLMYFYAAERFLAVIVLLGLCIVLLKPSSLAVLSGFVMGQTALVVARLFLKILD